MVIDTSVSIAALGGRGSASRRILRLCLQGRYVLLLSNALGYEYAQVALRPEAIARSGVSTARIEKLLKALFRAAQWRRVAFLLRPNLRDESDNHIVDLAVAGGAHAIVTYNIRDFAGGEFPVPGLKVLTPAQALKELQP